MKVVIPLMVAVLAGFAIGRWAGPSDRPVLPDSRTEASATTTSGGGRGSDWQDGPVTVDPSKFGVLLNEAMTSQLTMNAYGRNDGPAHTGYTAFTSRLGLREEQLPAFHRIFREAAEARLAWEAENVTARETAPNEWTLNFPGDGGEGKQHLAEKLEAEFGREMAQNIFLKTDIDALFEFTDFQEAFRHGELKVRVRTLKSDTFGVPDETQVAVRSGDQTVGFILGSNTIHPSGLPWRIARLVGGEDALRRKAAAP